MATTPSVLTSLVVPTVPPQATAVLTNPLGKGAKGAAVTDPTTMLFNRTWWLFFQALVAYMGAGGGDTGVTIEGVTVLY